MPRIFHYRAAAMLSARAWQSNKRARAHVMASLDFSKASLTRLDDACATIPIHKKFSDAKRAEVYVYKHLAL